uniref:HTH CENPB-type domain-containing protein n=1 Tax=Ascaris lumbricoides TaxID=6252 RepID=A0A9J2PMM9_ASCLU
MLKILRCIPTPDLRYASGNVRNAERPSQKGRKLKQYVLEEKLDIIDYAKVIGNRAAGREFNVAESSIREWRKNEQRLRSMFETAPERSRLDGGGRRPVSEDLEKSLTAPERSRLDGGGRRPVSEDLEKSLLLYVASTAGTHSTLTWHAIKEKANDIWNEICERDSDFKEKDFTANMGWVARFVKRNNIQLPAPSSPNVTPERNEESNPSMERSKNDDKEIHRENTVIGTTETTNSITNVAPQIVSPKRRRKNFTPKKLVEHPVVESNNILLETISESKSSTSSVVQPNETVVTTIDKDDEDENIDVCF